MKKKPPPILFVWIDEYELLLDSADINVPITKAIQEEADFVISFLGREAMKSEWVRRENLNGHLKEKNSFQITPNPIHLGF